MAKISPSESKEIDLTFQLVSEVTNADEVLERTVTAYGNSAHIPVPSKHLGKTAKVIIRKKREVKENKK